MPQEPEAPAPEPPRSGGEVGWLRALRWLARGAALAGVLAGAGALLALHPATPLPPQWNPAAPLAIAHPVTPLTAWKLDRTLATETTCRAALAEAGAAAEALPPREEGEACHVRQRVALSRVGLAGLAPVETRCDIALRLAYWERHGLQPAARAAFGTGVAQIEHLSSFACRPIRTGAGPSARMSLHATAEAIDISGFTLDTGRRVRLIDGWTGPPEEAAFLRAARDSACDWFATTLGPDYNALHADHFHLQSRGWGLCR